jgi:outer membrane protein assembly factor BamB
MKPPLRSPRSLPSSFASALAPALAAAAVAAAVAAAAVPQEPSAPRAAPAPPETAAPRAAAAAPAQDPRSSPQLADDIWPSFRGRFARGVADDAATPTTWDVAKGKGVRWRARIPGLAHSSPVVWQDRIFVTTAVKLRRAAAGDAPAQEPGTPSAAGETPAAGEGGKGAQPGERREQVEPREQGAERGGRSGMGGQEQQKPGAAAAGEAPSDPGEEAEAELVVGLYGSVEPVDDASPHRFDVLCVDRRTGEILWTRTAWQGVPTSKRHPKGSHAAATPTTDGERVVALFGSEGLYCYSVEGELLWQKDLGVLDAGWFLQPAAQWGSASSPVLHDGRVYLQCDVQGQSFVAALRADTGEEVWRVERDEVPTWGTPTIDIRPGRRQLICNGYRRIGAYDLDSGDALWWLRGGGDIPVPTPVVAGDLVYITNAHGRMSPILAISTAAVGELALDPAECDHMAWSYPRGGNYMQTPLVVGSELYCCNDMGILSCYDARTGERHYRKRLDTGVGFTASGVAAGDKLYFTSEEGGVYVIQAGPEYAELAVNELGETCLATPAIAGGTLYFRTRSHLLALGEQVD